MLLHIKKQEQSRQLVESAAEVHFDRYAMVPKGPNGTVHMSKHVIYIILVTKLTGEASNHAVLSSPYICMYVCMYVCMYICILHNEMLCLRMYIHDACFRMYIHDARAMLAQQ